MHGSQDSSREEVAGERSASASEGSQISEDEADPLKHVEPHLEQHRAQYESAEEEDEEEEEEDRELSEEELEKYTTSTDSIGSLSPSPPHPNSLAVMSRIYNLDTVGSRTGLYLRDRTVDIPSSVHLVKVKPFMSSSQQGDGKSKAGDDIRGVQTIQQQIEQFQLKEQEVLKSSANTSAKEREAKIQQSPKRELKLQVKEAEETPDLNPKESPQHLCSPTSQQKQTITINSSVSRTQSPDNFLKPTNCAPTPASSPCSPSPASSPSISPSPSASPKLFTIKSASGGPVKRGATITITPRKPVGGGATASVARPGTAVPAAASAGSAKAPPEQPMSPTVDEPSKKKYPMVEEIEVIGGYQNLERSCLVKSKVTPKRGKVCFDEDQLEQVCEYPSETFMLTLSPLPYDLEKKEKEAHKDDGEGEGGGGVVLKSTKSTGTATTPRLRVDESCPR